ncbi:MAG: flavin reductase [Firmicutes bacterium]|nr:flavin reductase [Bacillota bacterium]
MKEKINPFDHAETIEKALRSPGLLLNTNGDKFNSMVIGWGHLGTLWNLPTFNIYVRQSRFTKPQLDKTGEFTISVPLDGKMDPEVLRTCGSLSGRDADKAKLFTLVEPETGNTPALKEYPLTLECKILYKQDQDLSSIPEDIVSKFYSKGDIHTAYVGLITAAYIIKD